MAKTISASVGQGGANRPADVKIVQDLLNQVPVESGGPSPKLVADSFYGAKTGAAILKFQQTQFGTGDGRIDPGYRTMNRLSEFDSSSTGTTTTTTTTDTPPANKPPTNTPPTTDFTGLRKRIIDIATSMAEPPPGKVSDLVTMKDPSTGQTVRAGWEQLKEFFDVAVNGWTENHWKIPGYLDGVKKPGKRIPQPGTSGVSWCGIFATWVLIEAGLPVKWTLGSGINLPKHTDRNNIAPGDVCVIQEHVHHFIPISIEGDTMLTVNGNSDYQSINIKPRKLRDVYYYYRVPA